MSLTRFKRRFSRIKQKINNLSEDFQQTGIYQGTARFLNRLKEPALNFVKSKPNLIFMSSLAAIGAYSQCKTSITDILANFIPLEALNLTVIVVGSVAAFTTFISASFIIYKNITVLSNFAEKTLQQEKEIEVLKKDNAKKDKQLILLLKHDDQLKACLLNLVTAIKSGDADLLRATTDAITYDLEKTSYTLITPREKISLDDEEKDSSSTRHIMIAIPTSGEIELTTFPSSSSSAFQYNLSHMINAQNQNDEAIEIKDPEIVSDDYYAMGAPGISR